MAIVILTLGIFIHPWLSQHICIVLCGWIYIAWLKSIHLMNSFKWKAEIQQKQKHSKLQWKFWFRLFFALWFVFGIDSTDEPPHTAIRFLCTMHSTDLVMNTNVTTFFFHCYCVKFHSFMAKEEKKTWNEFIFQRIFTLNWILTLKQTEPGSSNSNNTCQITLRPLKFTANVCVCVRFRIYKQWKQP